jgi:DNA integrity scanning protein DisA with diadenylate cyclase activity
MKISNFDEVLDRIEQLSLEDQVALIDVVKLRLVERRRTEIAQNIADAKAEYENGQAFRVSIDDVMAQLNQ